MSLSEKRNVKCPKCGKSVEMEVFHSITIKDNPEQKQALLRGMINVLHCPKCGTEAVMPTPLLYHDEDRKLMISYTYSATPAQAQEYFESIKATSKESDELKNLDGYNLRFVPSLNALMEKIMIFDAGLSDKTIEFIKLVKLAQNHDKNNIRTFLFGKVEDDHIQFMIHDSKDNQIYLSNVPMEMYREIDTELKNSGVKPYSFDWEMVDRDYAVSLLGI